MRTENPFPARFPGYCPICGNKIREGEMIDKSRSGRWAHEKCVKEESKPKPKVEGQFTISKGSGYAPRGWTGWKKGDVVKNAKARIEKGGPEWLYVISSRREYVPEDGLSFGVGEDRGYIYSAEVRPATPEEAKPEIERRHKEQQKAEAKKSLKSLKARIRKEGKRPEGRWIVQGDRYFDTQTIYGGGDWFVVTDDHVWYVENHGADGDDWTHNNVQTGGAGAIGWRIPRDPETVAELDRIADTLKDPKVSKPPKEENTEAEEEDLTAELEAAFLEVWAEELERDLREPKTKKSPRKPKKPTQADLAALAEKHGVRGEHLSLNEAAGAFQEAVEKGWGKAFRTWVNKRDIFYHKPWSTYALYQALSRHALETGAAWPPAPGRKTGYTDEEYGGLIAGVLESDPALLDAKGKIPADSWSSIADLGRDTGFAIGREKGARRTPEYAKERLEAMRKAAKRAIFREQELERAKDLEITDPEEAVKIYCEHAHGAARAREWAVERVVGFDLGHARDESRNLWKICHGEMSIQDARIWAQRETIKTTERQIKSAERRGEDAKAVLKVFDEIRSNITLQRFRNASKRLYGKQFEAAKEHSQIRVRGPQGYGFFADTIEGIEKEAQAAADKEEAPKLRKRLKNEKRLLTALKEGKPVVANARRAFDTLVWLAHKEGFQTRRAVFRWGTRVEVSRRDDEFELSIGVGFNEYHGEYTTSVSKWPFSRKGRRLNLHRIYSQGHWSWGEAIQDAARWLRENQGRLNTLQADKTIEVEEGRTKNPHTYVVDLGDREVYVGQTGKDPQERFRDHKRGGGQANGRVQREGKRIRETRYAKDRTDAEKQEKNVASEYRKRGYTTHGGQGKPVRIGNPDRTETMGQLSLFDMWGRTENPSGQYEVYVLKTDTKSGRPQQQQTFQIEANSPKGAASEAFQRARKRKGFFLKLPGKNKSTATIIVLREKDGKEFVYEAQYNRFMEIIKKKTGKGVRATPQKAPKLTRSMCDRCHGQGQIHYQGHPPEECAKCAGAGTTYRREENPAKSKYVRQAVHFPQAKFTPAQARRWMRKHKIKPIKPVDRTENQLRYRLRDPRDFEPDSFVTLEIANGAQFVSGFLKPGQRQDNPSELDFGDQTAIRLRIPTDRFSPAKALDWAVERGAVPIDVEHKGDHYLFILVHPENVETDSTGELILRNGVVVEFGEMKRQDNPLGVVPVAQLISAGATAAKALGSVLV